MRQTLQTLLLVLLLALPGWSQDGPLRNAAPLRLPASPVPLPPMPAPVKRLGQRPTATPVANNVTTAVAINSGIVQVANLQYTSGATVTGASITLPAGSNTKGTLYLYNGGGTVGPTVTSGATNSYNFTTYPNLAFQPANGFSGPYTFTFTVTDAGGTSNVATYTINVTNSTAKPQTSQILLSSFAATPLSLPLAGTPDAGKTISN